jgi:diguanylate cyclase (GGDEF)-like protein
MFRHAFSIMGIVAGEDPTKHGMQVNGCRVLGGIRDLPALIEKHDTRMIVCALSKASSSAREAVFALAKTYHIRLFFLSDLVRFIAQAEDKPLEFREQTDGGPNRSEFNSLQDPFTELPNKFLLEERLRHSLAYSKRYHTTAALLHIDLNGSMDGGSIDEQKARDELLKLWAARLLKCKRESDTLARFRTHEFAFLLENVPNSITAEMILKRTRDMIAETIAAGSRALSKQPKIKLYFPLNNMEVLKELLRRDFPADMPLHKPLVSKAMSAAVNSTPQFISKKFGN